MRLRNKYLVKLESTRETEIKSSIPNLVLPSLKDRVLSIDESYTSYNPDLNLKKNGVVVSVPYFVVNEPIGYKSPGTPTPSSYISGEMLEKSNMEKKHYNPALFQHETLNLLDVFGTESLVDDTVYFHHTGLQYDNPVGEGMFPVDVKHIFAYEREGTLRAAKGYVILKRKEKDSTLTTRGLLLVHENKYVDNTGIVTHTSIGSKLSVDDVIVFKPKSDYPFPLHDIEFYASREDDVLYVLTN